MKKITFRFLKFSQRHNALEVDRLVVPLRDEKIQIYVINVEGGEAFPVTHVKENVQQFEWSPNGKEIALRMQQKQTKEEKNVPYDLH